VQQSPVTIVLRLEVTGYSYALMYRLGFASWERRDVADTWRQLLDGTDPPVTGRALDVGCGKGRDAVYLGKRGWRVTAVDSVDKALASAQWRAAEAGVEVQRVKGDVAALDWLGLEPGYSSTTSAASTASWTRRAQAPPAASPTLPRPLPRC
jgi:SAM-dependent methyltransferase